MNQHRIPRRLAALAAALALAGTAVLAVGPTQAKPPNWSMTVESLPEKASNGDTLAYLVSISNAGPSNISKLFLTADTPEGASLVAAIPSRGSCADADPLSCKLGALRKRQTTTVLVVYQAPEAGESMEVTFEATTSGATGSDGGTSHGDALLGTGTTLLSSDPDFAGRFIFDESQLVVENDQDIDDGNQHATKVDAPETGIPASVEDTNDDAGCEEAELPCFGQTSAVNVANGRVFGDGFLVTIIFGPDELPGFEPELLSYEYESTYPPDEGGFTADDLNIWHELDDGTGIDIPRCDDGEVEISSSEDMIPCFTAFDREGGGIQAEIITDENGNFRGY